MDVLSIVQSVGFPIAMCVVFCYAIKYLYDNNAKRERELLNDYQKSLNRFNESIKDNTNVLSQVLTIIKEINNKE